jgi:hypothetical protein
MKRFILFSALLLTPCLSLAQGFGGAAPSWLRLLSESGGTLTLSGDIVATSYTATAASGQPAFIMSEGGRFYTAGVGGGAYCRGASSASLVCNYYIAAPYFFSTAAAGQTALVGNNGAKFCPGADTACLTSNGTTITVPYLSVSGNLGVSGNVRAQYIYPSSSSAPLELKGNRASTGSAVAVWITNTDPLTTAGDHVVDFGPSDAGAAVSYIDIVGAYGMDGTDASGTPGATTINQPAGRVAVAAAASTLVVTNSIVTADSIVVPVVETIDATCTYARVTPAAGSFTITMEAACTANTDVSFVVHPMF